MLVRRPRPVIRAFPWFTVVTIGCSGSGGASPPNPARDAIVDALVSDGLVIDALGDLGPESSGPACTLTTLEVKKTPVKVSQLIGDVDRQTGSPTPDLTKTRDSLTGTDLGSSFEYNGRMFVLFGDSDDIAAPKRNLKCGDAIASTKDALPLPATGPVLEFKAFPASGGAAEFKSPVVPGVDLGCFDVPLTGVGDGAPNGTSSSTMYVWFATNCLSKSVLAKSTDEGSTFTLVGTTSDCQCPSSNPGPGLAYCTADGKPNRSCPATCHFINLSSSVVNAAAAKREALPTRDGNQVLLFGAGAYRAGSVYLATQPVSGLATNAGTRYFAGGNVAACAPDWSEKEADAQPLFDVATECAGAGVGELSGRYVAPIGKWIVSYNCARKIWSRAATHAFGPWSPAVVLFDGASADCSASNPDGFVFVPGGPASCDHVSDPGRTTEKGGVYGPYLMDRYVSALAGGGAEIVFAISTWNPYTAVVMKAEIE